MARLKGAVGTLPLGALALVVMAAGLIAFGIRQVGAQDTPFFANSGLLIYNVWVRPTAGLPAEGQTTEPPIPGTVTGAFMTIENTSENDYQLLGVDADAAEMTHVHETTSSGNMSGMRMISAIDIPAGETIKLESGGYHAMLMNVIEDVRPGDAVPLTLKFADADGATFEVVTAGLATDLPPEDGAIIAANAVARANEDETLDVSLILDNRGEAKDTLVGVSSNPAATVGLIDGEAVLASIELPAVQQTVTIHLSDFSETPVGALVLTLTFETGGEVIVAAPVVEGDV